MTKPFQCLILPLNKELISVDIPVMMEEIFDYFPLCNSASHWLCFELFWWMKSSTSLAICLGGSIPGGEIVLDNSFVQEERHMW